MPAPRDVRARPARLGHLDARRADGKHVAHAYAGFILPAHGEVLGEAAGAHLGDPELRPPPGVVLGRVRQHGAVRPAVVPALVLLVALEAERSEPRRAR